MAGRWCCVFLFLAASGTGLANGRDPYASTINFEPGNANNIMAGMTFGLIRSSDGGATWQWYCEKTVGYGGTYDPDYAYTATGAVFATTFDGLKVMRDGCAFVATPPGMTFVSHVERAPNGDVYFAASDPNDAKIYKSSNDGASFDVSANPGMTNDWWQSISVAPSNSMHVYLTGYRLPLKCVSGSNSGNPCAVAGDCPGGTCEPVKEFLLYSSTNAGVSYSALGTTGISPTSQNSVIDVVGIDPTHENIVYVRVSLENATSGDSIYKSTDSGATWTKILTKASTIGGLSFLVRGDGSCVAGTRDIGSWKAAATASGCGTTWTDLTGAPHIGCLFRNPANDEVWACTQNTASAALGLTSDGYGIMKSSDVSTWTGVLRFQDIQAPVACGSTSVQQTECIDKTVNHQSGWCCLTTQLGITSTVIDCTGALACFGATSDAPPDGPPDASSEPPADAPITSNPSKGCCDASSGAPIGLSLLVVGFLLPRRRTSRRPRG